MKSNTSRLSSFSSTLITTALKKRGGRRSVAEKRFAEKLVQDRALTRLKRDGIGDLKNSILANGFVPVERIVVKPFMHGQEGDESFVVLEGNRRVATLREIQRESESGVEIPEQVLDALSNIPVVKLNSEDESAYLTVMGMRHVGGIKEWGGYQSARLVFELRTSHQLETPEVAAKLGLSAIEVNRRFRAFQAIEQMRSDDEYGEYVTTELYPIFHEVLASPKLKTWLQWNDDEGKAENAETRQILYSLVSPSQDESQTQQPPKIASYSDVREMRTLLDNEDAYESLLNLDVSLSDAVAIVKAEQASQSWIAKAKSTLSALQHVGLWQINNLEDKDVELLHSLSQIAGDILKVHSQAQSEEE